MGDATQGLGMEGGARWLAGLSASHWGSGSGTTWDLGRLVGTGSPRSIIDGMGMASLCGPPSHFPNLPPSSPELLCLVQLPQPHRVVLVGRRAGAGALWCGCVLTATTAPSTCDHPLVHCPLSPRNTAPPTANTPPGPWDKPQHGVAVVALAAPGLRLCSAAARAWRAPGLAC